MPKKKNKGGFKNGNKYGKGRPKGSADYKALLLRAIKRVEKKHKINYMEQVVEVSLGKPEIMKAILTILIPPKTIIDSDKPIAIRWIEGNDNNNPS